MNIAIIGLGKLGEGLASALENTVHNITRVDKGDVQTAAAKGADEPCVAGRFSNVRYLEPLGYVNMKFGHILGQGVDIAPQWLAA